MVRGQDSDALWRCSTFRQEACDPPRGCANRIAFGARIGLSFSGTGPGYVQFMLSQVLRKAAQTIRDNFEDTGDRHKIFSQWNL